MQFQEVSFIFPRVGPKAKRRFSGGIFPFKGLTPWVWRTLKWKIPGFKHRGTLFSPFRWGGAPLARGGPLLVPGGENTISLRVGPRVPKPEDPAPKHGSHKRWGGRQKVLGTCGQVGDNCAPLTQRDRGAQRGGISRVGGRKKRGGVEPQWGGHLLHRGQQAREKPGATGEGGPPGPPERIHLPRESNTLGHPLRRGGPLGGQDTRGPPKSTTSYGGNAATTTETTT